MSEYKVPFEAPTTATLQYHVYSTGLNIHRHGDGVKIKVLNSRGRETPGYIFIPAADLDNVIRALDEARRET